MYDLFCPHCGKELHAIFHRRVALYRCPDGHGEALTVHGARTLTGSSPFINHLWQQACNHAAAGSRACPVCRKAMKTVLLTAENNPVELDVCCRCQEIWFDPQEISILPSPPAAAEDQLPAKAREIMALHAVEQQSAAMETAEANSHAPDSVWQYLAGLCGFPVEKDAPPLKRIPLVTYAIILLCALIYALSCRDLSGAAQAWGFIPRAWERYGGLTFFSSMFMHGSLWHLLGNMYFLWIFGDNVEDFLGWKKFLLLILFSEVSAQIFYILLAGSGNWHIPCVGASGFISGIIAVYACLYPQVKIALCSRWGIFFYWWGIPAWAAFGVWLALQTVMALCNTTSNIAYSSHLGGAAAGLLLGLFIRYRNRQQTLHAQAFLE